MSFGLIFKEKVDNNRINSEHYRNNIYSILWNNSILIVGKLKILNSSYFNQIRR